MPEQRAGQIPVYVVDDDQAMVNSITQWLDLSGLSVRGFSQSAALLRTLRAGDDCVIVSDVRMPDMDGLELLTHVLRIDRSIPVILVTGHGDVPLAVEAMKKGAFEFLTKPFSPEHLLETVRTAQSRQAAEPSGRQVRADDADQAEGAGELAARSAGVRADGRLHDQVGDFERAIIVASLKKHGGNISRVMAELALPRRTLNAKMKKYAISRKQ